MDYKKNIKSRKTRLAIIELLSWLPDKVMLKLQYRVKFGRSLHLHNPQRYTEKAQWYKLFYRDAIMISCVDKYDVREYVKNKGLGNILNECYAVYDDADDIDFDALPKKFVMKNTLGTGGTSVVICQNKNKEDLENLRSIARTWINKGIKKGGGLEWPYYSGKKPRIIFERLLEVNNDGGLIDYKFMCFQGKPEFVFYLSDRKMGVSVKEAICDANLNVLPYREIGDEIPSEVIKPKNYEEMLRCAKLLSEDCPSVRVDLYNVEGKIVFGELTFFDASGYSKYDPDDYDYVLGEKFLLPMKGKKQ